MIIENYEVVQAVTSAINEYNDQFWDKEDRDKKIPYDSIKFSDDEDRMEIPDEILSKIPNINLVLRPDRLSEEEITEIFESLKSVLDVMKPKSFRLSMIQKKGVYPNFDMSILDHLPDDIGYIGLTGIDLSKEGPEIFSRFKSLKTLSIEKCNISDPSIVDEVSPDTIISLRRNEIPQEYYSKAIELLQRSKGRVGFSNKELDRLSDILKLGHLSIEEYLKYKDVIDLSSIPSISIKMIDKSNLTKEQFEEFIEIFNSSSNINLEISPENVDLLDPERKIEKPIKLAIRDLRELPRERLASMPSAESIRIIDYDNPNREEFNIYSVDEYNAVEAKIQEIVSQVVLPRENDPHREMKIFTQVYKLLGKSIVYDHDAISEEGKQDEKLRLTCRNLIGGLTKGTCVCAGYADILKNVLAMFNIHSEYISAFPDFENGVPMNLNDPEGHAWNLVTLDGQSYWTDLTWDAPFIQAGRYPLPYCLKSTKEFGHKDFKKRTQDLVKDPAPRSVSREDQIRLFTGEEIEPITEEAKKEETSIAYLGAYTLAQARKGTSIKALQKAEQCCELALKAPDKSIEEEVK